jgi:signal transduction histidine kinase/DNA-binding response OmpR family regulator
MKFIIVIFLIFLSLSLKSQTSELDSLKNILVSTEGETEKIHLTNEIGFAYLKANLDSAMSCAYQALKLNTGNIKSEKAKSHFTLGKVFLYMGKLNNSIQHFDTANILYRQIGDARGMAESYNKTGVCQMLIENYKDSEKVLDSAFKYAVIAQDSIQIIRAYLNISSLYHYKADYDMALQTMYKALEIIEITDNLKLRITAYLNLGNINLVRGNNDKALENLLKAAGYCESSSGKERQLSYCYLKIGDIYLSKGDGEKAAEYGLKSLALTNATHMNANIVSIYSMIGLSFLEQNDFDNALDYCTKALDLSKKLELPKLIADSYSDLGLIYLNMKDYGRSIEYLEKTLESFSSVENKFPLAKSFDYLATAYAGKGNYKKAYEYQLKHDLLQDTLLDITNEEQIIKLETEFKVKEKEALIEFQDKQMNLQNEKISQQRILNFAFGFIVILLLIVVVLYYVNIKRRKKINKQLKLLDRSKSRFFTNISHEMRNPLTLIMAPLQNLSEKMKNSPFHEDIQLACSNSKKLLDRVNEILDLSKLESGQIVLNESSVVLHDLCQRIFYSYKSLASYRNMELEFEFLPESNLSILLDIEKFEKILNNLLLNAFKHSETEGVILLNVTSDEKLLSFTVKDTGQGIHENDLKYIFDRYFQAEMEDTPARGGTGVGLTLAREYARIFGGDIKVVSSPGKGSSFTLTIPYKKSDKTKQAFTEYGKEEEKTEKDESIVNLPLSVDGYKPKILVVEDELEMSRYLVKCLSDSYYCKSASNGIAALKLLGKEQFDLIMSDVMMPKMDGLQFRSEVRKNPDWKHIPFIMLTAKALDEDKITGLQLGVDDYITKPFNTKELIARVHNLILNKHERDLWLKDNQGTEETDMNYSAEEQLIIKAEKFVLENLPDHRLNAVKLAEHLGYSQRQLERLLKKQIGFSPAAFIREIRLQKAYKILERRQFATIKEVCYEVGMDTPANFSTRFKQRFGKNPTEVLNTSNF